MPIFLIAVLAILLGLIYAAFIEPKRLILNRLSVPINGLSVGVRILFISDLHANIGQISRLQQLLGRLPSTERPSLLILGGDFLHRGKGLAKVEEILATLQTLNLPMIAVLGNHDLMGDQKTEAKLAQALISHRVLTLKNNSTSFKLPNSKQSIQIIGIDELERDANYYDRRNFRQPNQFKDIAVAMSSLAGIEETASPRLLIAHNPDGIYVPLGGSTPELVLSGHTHGGQVFWLTWLPQWFWRFLMRYRFYPAGSHRSFAGTKSSPRQTHLISRGMSGHPLRFGRVPEAHLIELVPRT